MFFEERDNEFLPLDMILVVEQKGRFATSKPGKLFAGRT